LTSTSKLDRSSSGMVHTSSFRALLALCATAFASAEYFQGDGTTYTLSEVSSGNCNFMSANGIAAANYAALNEVQWRNLSNCGRCAQVSCIDSRCADPTASAVVQIVDRCPECKYGDLDLSPTVFKAITGSDPSRLAIRWQFVDCPSEESVKICLKNGSNGYWIAVQPTNARVGIQSVAINGQAATMLDGAYYYLVTASSGVDLTAVKVAVTSVNAEVIEGTYSLSTGQCTDTYRQFAATGSTTSSTPEPSMDSLAASTEAPAATTAAPETPASTTEAPATTRPAKCYVRQSRS
jgi:expansin (peptidoglycan-binding protein)